MMKKPERRIQLEMDLSTALMLREALRDYLFLQKNLNGLTDAKLRLLLNQINGTTHTNGRLS